METTTLLERVREFFNEHENQDEYKDDMTGLIFYQDYTYGILIKVSSEYQDDDPYFIWYSDL